jgi:uncharacterized membrane protein
MRVVSQQFQGPLPPPELLDQYDQVAPGAAKAIIEMAQKQAAHRQQLEIEAQRADIQARELQLNTENQRIQGILSNDRFGTFLGWTVAVLCACGAIWSMAYDKPWQVTIAFIGLPIASIINALRVGGKQKREN